MFYTYILTSLKNNRHYFGHTKDLQNRLKRHNAGKVRSTKAFRPWEIHYYENFNTKSEAFKREMFFKSLEGRIWLRENNII
ncbi:MAG: GIY-YIG nuclease family protein [Chlorobi bacterium]|nr:GIY-YIG nuclease family protein [Chlorobiota bacterium]